MKILTTAMKTSISEVMETMFYLPVEFGEDTPGMPEGIGNNSLNMACKLTFSGDCSGCLTLVIPKDLLEEMAENFMGEPRDQLGEEHLSGTLTETLNMVCGNALSTVAAEKPFELGIPKMIHESEISNTGVFIMVETAISLMAINISLD